MKLSILDQSPIISGRSVAQAITEVFRMLEALYPGRIDLGIGRAPGGRPAHRARRGRRAPKGWGPLRPTVPRR